MDSNLGPFDRVAFPLHLRDQVPFQHRLYMEAKAQSLTSQHEITILK